MSNEGTPSLIDLGMKLAVPFNHDLYLFTVLEPRAESIAEVFVPPPFDLCGTFRAWNGPDPDDYRKSISGLTRQARKIGISVNMAINPPYVPLSEHAGIARYVMEAVDQGVDSFTIGDLHLAETIRDVCPAVKLVASATADIAHVTRARHWIRQAGVARIVPSRIINKDVRMLSLMAGLGVIIEIIPNEQCLPACPYIFQHAMTIGSRQTVDETDFRQYCSMCAVMKAEAPWEHYQTEIVPASVYRYHDIVSLVKLAGRDSTTSYIVSEIDRFIQLESDSTGFLGGYREPPEVFDKVASCDRVCEKCGFCRRVFESANPGWAERARFWLDKVTFCPGSR
ncbi:MAG: U32 family peptidase [Anaerolineales bacterium]|nr:U32 family peptidase [Anaerolineales bacterium]